MTCAVDRWMTIAQLESLATWSGTRRDERVSAEDANSAGASFRPTHNSLVETLAGHLFVCYVSSTDG